MKKKIEACAHDLGEKCNALREKQCVCCAFRKTKEELEAGRIKAALLVADLPVEKRLHISRKYYG